MIEFDWDAAKARANERRHGVSFEEARRAFDDPRAVELYDDRFAYGEDRFVLIAMVGERIITVVYASRGENRARIISARPAGRLEADEYFKQNR